MYYEPILKLIRDDADRRATSMAERVFARPLKRVWLRATNWLGDALMTLPAAWQLSKILQERLGEKRLEYGVICPAFMEPLWRSCPWVTEVLPMKGKRLNAAERRKFREFKADLAVLFPNSFGAAWDLWRARKTPLLGRAGRWRRLLLAYALPEWPRVKAGKGADCHQLSWYLDLVSSLGRVNVSSEYPALTIDESLAEQLGMERGRDWLVLAPGAKYGPAKQWFLENYAEIGRRQVMQGGGVVCVGSGQEVALTAELAERCRGGQGVVLDLGGKTTLNQLMSIFRKASAAVCNDSGSMHLAAACGCPGVAVFGSTDPIATGPVFSKNSAKKGGWILEVAQLPCRPCFARQCPQGDYRCLHSITADQVWHDLEELKK